MTGKAVNSPKTGAGRHELPTELETPLPAALYLNLKSVRSRICGHGAQRGANRTSPAPLSAAAPPSCPGRGFQRGGPQPAPLCRFKGVRGEIEIPPRFSLGGPWGHSLFKREYPPWLPHTESVCFHRESRLIMKYPPDPKILLRFPRYGPSGPEGYPPAGGRTPPPSAPHPPA